MRDMTMKKAISKTLALVALALSLAATAYAAAPGISGAAKTPTFNLTAQEGYLNQPDGESVYSWGYGCQAGFSPTFLPANIIGATCPTMQVPGPTLIVTEGDTVTINLLNSLPTPAGNTSLLFPGFTVNATGGVAGLLTQEAAPGGSVTYQFVASAPGTHPYYSGTQGDLQIEMGMYGALVVLPAKPPANCSSGYHALNTQAQSYWGEDNFRLAAAAYDHPASCYDREYLFQWGEMDSRIHRQAAAQVAARAKSGVCLVAGVVTPSNPGCSLEVQTEPYHPAYFIINGRSMPDLMDPNFAGEYPHQPYNANPHVHPGELLLIRVLGQGRWQHPYHEHANHVRILARDGNLILSASSTPITYSSGLTGDAGAQGRPLAGILMFNTDTTPGESFDGIFYFTGRGLNWDPYGHHPGPDIGTAPDANGNPTVDDLAHLSCTPDVNGYNSGDPTAVNYFEWCQDHNKPVEVSPFGDVGGGGPATLPNPNVFTNGPWYGGSPYFGPDAVLRSTMPACAQSNGSNNGGIIAPGCTNLQPANLQLNPANERGWAFMWHSHNEREITTNNVFPGGMLMMLLVDSREFKIDESQ
jgi:hypothetical protein